jgi:hypothetical protein
MCKIVAGRRQRNVAVSRHFGVKNMEIASLSPDIRLLQGRNRN